MAFPTTGILDNFNRANQGPPPSTNWKTTGAPGWAVLSNVCDNTAAADSWAEQYWNLSMYGPDCEVYMTVTRFPNVDFREMRLELRTQSPASSRNSYTIHVANNTPPNRNVVIERIDAGTTVTEISATVTQSMADGDSIGLEAIGSSLTAYYKPSAGAWTSLVSATDATYSSAGFLYLDTVNTATHVQVDDFGGGTIAPLTPQLRDAAHAHSASTTSANLAAPVPACNVGDRLIMAVGKDGTAAVTWPASPAWSVITNAAGTDAATASIYADVRYRDIDGTEGWSAGGTITVDGASEAYGSYCWRITNHDPTVAPECAAATGATGNADPPNLAPSWGATETLWLAFAAVDGNVTFTGFPANYSESQLGDGFAATAGINHAVAARHLNAASENPGAFANTTEGWRALTIAVKPAVAVAESADRYGPVIF